MSKNLNEVIENFMLSETYHKMLKIYQDKEFEKVQSIFFDTLTEITAIATKNNKKKTEKVESIVIAYLAKVEVLGVFIGFKFAFNLFMDLSEKKGGVSDEL